MTQPHDLSAWSHSHRFESGHEGMAERRTRLALWLNLAAMIAEIGGGILFNSMALQADGWHMFTHVGALGLAAFAYGFARRHGDNPDFVFGTGKVSALAGFSSALVLLVVALLIVWESGGHLIHPQPILFDQALPVAGVAVAVNLATLWVLGEHGHDHDHHHHDDDDDHDHDHHHHDHNLRAAYLHVIGDTVTALLAMIALLAGRFWGLNWMDPIMGMISALVIASWSASLIKSSGAILLDHNDQTELRQSARAAIEQDGESWVSDLHLWRVSPSHHAVLLSVVSHRPKEPSYYKSRLSHLTELAHITIEVHECKGGDQCLTPN